MDATDQLVVGFSRNPNKFKLARYGAIRPVKKSAGKYLRWRSQQGSRLVYPDLRDRVWADGADRPTGANNLERFEFEPFMTTRYDFPYTMGRKAIEQADFMVQTLQDATIVQQALTGRTSLGTTALSGASWGNNTGAVDNSILASGQNWSNGTTTAPNVKKSLLYGTKKIALATQGGVNVDDLALVMGPDTAIAMSSSPEVHNAFVQSQFALNQAMGDKNLNADWGLPPKLYGIHVVVEDAVATTSQEDAASLAQSFILPSGVAYLVTRPKAGTAEGLLAGNGDEADENLPIISTLVGFFYEEMTVEAFDDARNRRVDGHVVEDYQWQVSSVLSGFKFTACLG